MADVCDQIRTPDRVGFRIGPVFPSASRRLLSNPQLGLDGEIFDLGYEKWLLQVDEVFEHQGPWITYYLRFMNPNAPAQERKLNVTVSYAALATKKKDRHRRPERLWHWIYGWLFDKRPTETLNFDQEFEMQQV